ncbi:unnamed protein product [Cylindrotheca closterium]|uniref:Uncharacterized protein n=1 Tax=Cylindrotheca closterium TaxID=2856 RepID=A0AAD2CK99_9STRA|nr:unnamed protein product [Cylindrotheca closterium]
MARRQKAKRAAAAAAEAKIKNDVEAINMTEGKAKRRMSSKSRAAHKGNNNAKEEPKKERDEKKKKASGIDPEIFPPNQEDASSCEWTQAPSDPSSAEEEDEAMEAHEEHMRRRALREVHSNQPMRLSRRSSYRISRGRVDTPVYSPIYATQLKLTPDADASCLQDDDSL